MNQDLFFINLFTTQNNQNVEKMKNFSHANQVQEIHANALMLCDQTALLDVCVRMDIANLIEVDLVFVDSANILIMTKITVN